MNSSFNILTDDLRKIGIKAGDVILVHSSLSSMGFVEGGAKTVIDALEAVIGKEGTLLFPSFTYREVYETHRFSICDSEVCVGKIPETFRKEAGVIRSIHPTHSVCARGRFAKEITKNHELDRTPMGTNSPFRRLCTYNAKILMLGCSLGSTSFMHALEEEGELEYCLTPYEVEYTVVDEKGNQSTDKYRKHNFKRKNITVKQCYTRCIDVLTEGIDYKRSTVHGADSYLIDSIALHDKALLRMKSEPYYFVDLPDGYAPGAE